MSKKFDEEFKAYIAEDIPDLWDRIEASLPEKTPEKAPESVKEMSDKIKETPDSMGETQADRTAGQKEPAKGKKKKSIKRYLPIMIPSICAAAIILMLFPAFLLPMLMRSGLKSGPAEGGSTGGTNHFASDTAGASVEYTAEESYYDEDMADGYDAGAGVQGNAGVPEKNETIAASISDSAQMDKGMEEEAENAEEAKETQVFVRACILKYPEENNGLRICLMALLEDLPEDFPVRALKQEELTVLIDPQIKELPGPGEECGVWLEYLEGEEIPVIISDIEF